MKTIYKSFIREINTLGWEAEFLTDHVEFFYQGYRFRVVLEDEEDDLLRISANILSTDKSVREWIAILFECEGTWESPTYVYDVREEGDTFHIDVAISALFLFSQDIHNTALYFQDYVMREIMKKIEMIYECFRENYDKNFNVQLAEKGEFPTHSVTLHDYYLGETEVTQELWEEVMGYNPANTIGASLPIENISWNDCADFIRELNNRTGKTFRLPTEAEWEYAARGGIYSRQCVYSGSDNAEEVGWVKSNCDGSTHPVGTRNSNELGIYDMTGNVCEWCQDWMSNYNSTDQVNPVGPNSGTARVGRGGGWCNSSLKNRVSTRFAGKTTYRDYNLGFRIAM